MEQIMKGIEYRLVGQQDLYFKCNCSFERLRNILSSLSEEEMNKMLNEEGQIEVVCNFCNEVYHYRAEDILKTKKPQTLKSKASFVIYVCYTAL